MPYGHNLNKFKRGPLDYAMDQITSLYAMEMSFFRCYLLLVLLLLFLCYIGHCKTCDPGMRLFWPESYI